MDRFDAMQAFARVVETGSFTKAASTLHMSKTSVTQLVQQLEARLRVKLLNRTTRKVNVTADGAVYYERVVRLLGVYATPGYVQRMGTPAHPQDLENSHHRIVGYLWARTGKALPYAMRRGEESLHVHGRYVLAVDDGNSYLAAGLAGMGVLWLPDYMARPHLASGGLVRLFEDWQMDSMPMYVAFPPNRNVSVKVRAFIDWVAELLAEHAPLRIRERP